MRGLLSRFTGDDDVPDDGEVQERMVELLEVAATRQYSAEPVRPWMLVGSRVVLWGAVAAGAFGGVAGCLGSANRSEEPPVAAASDDPALVPPQVTSVAEHVVERWLVATVDDEDEIRELFVEVPELPMEVEGRELHGVRAVSSLVREDDYWSVTVAADLELLPPSTEDESTDEEAEYGPVTWYVEVGIVGDPQRELRALRAPAIMPAPPEIDTGWSSTAERWESPAEDDPLASTIDEFLDALLAGRGNPDRYLAEGSMEGLDPAPFVDVLVDQLAVEELEDGSLRIQALVIGETASGIEQPLAYELDVRSNGEQFEIVRQWGSATLAQRPADEAES